VSRPSLTAVCAAACVLLAGCGQDSKTAASKVDQPSVLVAVPKQGPLRDLGLDTERAARMEFERQTTRPALRQLKLVSISEAGSGEDFSNAAQVAKNTQGLVDTGMVVGMVGGIDSDALAVELPRLNEAGIAAVSPAATATPFNRRDEAFPGAPIKYYPAFAQFGLSFARTAPSDLHLIGPCLRQLAATKIRNVFTVDSGDTDGDSVSSAVEATAPSEGLVLVGHESVPKGNADWPGIVRQIGASRAEAVIWGSAAGTGETDLLKEMKSAGLSSRLMLGPSIPPDFLKKLDPVRGGASICSASVPPALQSSSSAAFAEQFRSRWGHEPAPGALRGAAAMALLLTAIERGANRSLSTSTIDAARQGITRSLSRTRSVNSLLGPVRLDTLGNWSDAPIGVWSLSGNRPRFRQL